MTIQDLIEKYLLQIAVTYTDFEPKNDTSSDSASIALLIPLGLITEYQKIKCDANAFPDPVQFWKESNLAAILRNSNKIPTKAYAPLRDVLEFLHGEVECKFTSYSDTLIKLSIDEYLGSQYKDKD